MDSIASTEFDAVVVKRLGWLMETLEYSAEPRRSGPGWDELSLTSPKRGTYVRVTADWRDRTVACGIGLLTGAAMPPRQIQPPLDPLHVTELDLRYVAIAAGIEAETLDDLGIFSEWTLEAVDDALAGISRLLRSAALPVLSGDLTLWRQAAAVATDLVRRHGAG